MWYREVILAVRMQRHGEGTDVWGQTLSNVTESETQRELGVDPKLQTQILPGAGCGTQVK